MKKAIYIHTNAYDMILMPDGTFVQVDTNVMLDYLDQMWLISEPMFADWHGNDRWDDFAGTMDEAVEVLTNEGAQALAYFEGHHLEVVDQQRFVERIQFYGVTPPSQLWISK
mgnify:CR=1 FL=1|jgi:hypothetical protein